MENLKRTNKLLSNLKSHTQIKSTCLEIKFKESLKR